MSRIRFRILVLMLGSLVPHVGAVSADEARKDVLGDPLPPGARARLGTVRLRHAGPVTMLRFSPDGKRLLSRGYNTLCLWSTATGEQLLRQTSDSHDILGAFTTEGDVLVVFHDKMGIHLTNAMTGKRLRTIPAPEKPIHIFLAPNGKYLGVAAGEGSGRVHLWETATAKEIATFAIAHPGFAPLFFSADGKSLVEVDYESGIRIRETATGMVRGRIAGVKRTELTSLAISPDGKRLATGGYDHIVHLWDATTGKEERTLQNQSASLEFSPDGQTLVCGGWDGVSLFDAATGKKRRFFRDHIGAVTATAYSADGKVLATGGGGLSSHRIPLRYHDSDCTIRLWDAASGKELPPALGPRAAVVALAYSPDGKVLASAGKVHPIRLWCVADGKLLRRLEGYGGTVFSLAFSPNGKLLASASHDNSVRLWEAATGKVLHELKGHDGGVTAVAFSPDGKMIASVGGDKKPIYLWDVSTGKEIRMLRGHTSDVFAVAFSPDGRVLATGGGQSVLLPPSPGVDNSIRLWNPRSGQELRRLPGENNDFAFFTVTFSPDGKTIAAGCINGPIRLWEAATGAERLTIESAGDGAIVFSPDGRTLAAASPRYSDWTIRLWDALTGKERRRLHGHDGEVYAVAFSPDGKTLASASQDTTVLIWDVADLGRLKPPAKGFAAKELEALWDCLAQSDAPQAYQAIRTLVEGKQTVPFLRERLQPIRVTVNRQWIDKLIADLDSDRFAVRARAVAELRKLGGLAEPALRKAIASRPPLEVRRRVENLLDRLDHHVLTGEELRGLRAVETLEHIDNAEARRVLETLARGTPGFRLTDEARAAVERLGRRSAANP